MKLITATKAFFKRHQCSDEDIEIARSEFEFHSPDSLDSVDHLIAEINSTVESANSSAEMYLHHKNSHGLPEELAERVFGYLEQKDLLSCSLVSKEFRESVLTHSDFVVRPKFRYGQTPDQFKWYIECCRQSGTTLKPKIVHLGYVKPELLSLLNVSGLFVEELEFQLSSELPLNSVPTFSGVRTLMISLDTLSEPLMLYNYVCQVQASSLRLKVDQILFDPVFCDTPRSRGISSIRSFHIATLRSGTRSDAFAKWLLTSLVLPDLHSLSMKHLGLDPGAIRFLTSLNSLSLLNCPLQLGTVFKALDMSGTRISSLHYNGEAIVGKLPDLTFLNSLSSLSIDSFTAQYDSLLAILKAADLRHLILRNSVMNFDTFPFDQLLKSCPHLETLSLSGSPYLYDSSCLRLASCLINANKCTLSELYLCDTAISKVGLQYLFRMVSPLRLNKLCVCGCNLDREYTFFLQSSGYCAHLGYEAHIDAGRYCYI